MDGDDHVRRVFGKGLVDFSKVLDCGLGGGW